MVSARLPEMIIPETGLPVHSDIKRVQIRFSHVFQGSRDPGIEGVKEIMSHSATGDRGIERSRDREIE